MRYSISKAADLVGVSVRTLRYYDEIGLLKPSEITPAGYRFYDDTAMAALQQILFYRELDVPLGQIAHILSAPENDRNEALQKHRTLLLMRRRRLDDMLRLVDETIGGIAMYEDRPNPTQQDWEAIKAQYGATQKPSSKAAKSTRAIRRKRKRPSARIWRQFFRRSARVPTRLARKDRHL